MDVRRLLKSASIRIHRAAELRFAAARGLVIGPSLIAKAVIYAVAAVFAAMVAVVAAVILPLAIATEALLRLGTWVDRITDRAMEGIPEYD